MMKNILYLVYKHIYINNNMLCYLLIIYVLLCTFLGVCIICIYTRLNMFKLHYRHSTSDNTRLYSANTIYIYIISLKLSKTLLDQLIFVSNFVFLPQRDSIPSVNDFVATKQVHRRRLARYESSFKNCNTACCFSPEAHSHN